VGRAGRGSGSFAVGFMPGLIVTPVVRALGAAHPDLTIDVVRTGWEDQVEVLHDGRVDVSLVRLPIDQTGLRLVPLFSEPRLVALPAEHRLAAKAKVSIADLADEHLLQDPAAVPEWKAIASELRSPASRRPIPTIRTVEEKLEYVATGEGIAILPQSTTTFYRRSDVACVPVDDISDNQVSLAWEAARRSRLINEFADLARRHAQRAGTSS
jgi:DNA-binding transcriptional LysR family regulator